MSEFGQIVLVLQGGGALGAYQAGVYEAMHEAGIEPDWVIGTSIGAINASLIAGAEPDDRVARLRAFWDRVAQDPVVEAAACFPVFGMNLPNWITLTSGVSDFFEPNPRAFLGPQIRLARGRGRLLLDAAARGDLARSRRLLPRQQMRAAPHRRRRQCAHRRNALFRQPRRADHGAATSWRRARCRRLSRRSASTANYTGTAAFSRTRRSRRCSTTSRGAIR